MKQKTKFTILVVACLQLIAALTLFSLPSIVRALPGRLQNALPQEIVALSITPNPTVPPPDASHQNQQVVIPNLKPTEIPTVIPSPTTELTPIANSSPTPLPSPTTIPTPIPSPTLPPLNPTAMIDGVKNIPQNFNNCGPTNVTLVLNFYGNETTQATAAAFLKPNPLDRNVSPWQLSDYVNEQTDLRSTAHSGGTIELLMRLVDAGFPVVIEKGYEPPNNEGWMGHYLTVIGYNQFAQELYSLDTYLGPFDGTTRTDSFANVEKYWQQFNNTFFVVHRPHQEAQVKAILGETLTDPLKMWEYAAVRAQAEIETDPTNVFAWFNLGTSLTRLGEISGEAEYYTNGAAAFDQARTLGWPPRMLWYQFRPYVAYMKTGRYNDMITLADNVLASEGGRNVEETYLYKGHALVLSGGDYYEAQNAYKRALQLNSNFYPAQWALDSLQGN